MFGLSSILLFGSSARSFEDDAVCEAKQDTGSQIGKFLTRRVDRDRVLEYEGHAMRTCGFLREILARRHVRLPWPDCCLCM
jgi:hypothetical protein